MTRGEETWVPFPDPLMLKQEGIRERSGFLEQVNIFDLKVLVDVEISNDIKDRVDHACSALWTSIQPEIELEWYQLRRNNII